MTSTPAIGQRHAIERDQPQAQAHSLRGNESTLFSRILSSAEECLGDFRDCLPEVLTPGVKYLWVPVAVVVGVIAKINLTYLALSALSLLALQMIYVHLSERGSTPHTAPSTNSGEIDVSSHSPAATNIETRAQQPRLESERTDTGVSDTEALVRAAKAGNIEEIQRLLDSGVDVNCSCTSTHRTPLMVAAYKGHQTAVERLLNRGASIDYQSRHRYTALMFAAKKGHTSIVELLVARGADLNDANASGNTALSLAHYKGHRETSQTIERLLRENSAAQPDLIREIVEGTEETVEKLIAEGADINCHDRFGTTALMHAAIAGEVEILTRLLEANARVDQSNSTGHTALMMAARCGHVEVMEKLLQRGASVNLVNQRGETALMIAARNGYSTAVQLLVEHPDIDLDRISSTGETAVSLARRYHRDAAAHLSFLQSAKNRRS